MPGLTLAMVHTSASIGCTSNILRKGGTDPITPCTVCYAVASPITSGKVPCIVEELGGARSQRRIPVEHNLYYVPQSMCVTGVDADWRAFASAYQGGQDAMVLAPGSEWNSQFCELVDSASQRKNISRIAIALPVQNFWCNVCRCAYLSLSTCISIWQDSGNPKVAQYCMLAIETKENVCRFHIPMDHVNPVQILESTGNLQEPTPNVYFWQSACQITGLRYPALQVSAVQILHDYADAATLHMQIDESYYVWMADSAEQARLLEGQLLLSGRHAREVHLLQRQPLARPLASHLPHLTSRAPSKALEQVVALKAVLQQTTRSLH